MKRVAWVAVALVAGAAASWWWESRRSAIGVSLSTTVAAPAVVKSDALPDVENLPITPPVSEPREDARESTPATVVGHERASATARLRVTVRAKEDGKPLSGIRVLALRSDGFGRYVEVQRPGGNLGEPRFTGAEGIVELEVDAAVAHQLQLTVSDYHFESRTVDPIDAGATFEITVDVPTREDVRLFGQLVDGDDRHALVGRVRFLNGEREGQIVETNGTGFFALTAGSWNAPYVQTEVEAYVPATFTVKPGFEDPNHPLVVMLLRAAIVDVVVRDSAGLPIANALVELGADVQHFGQQATWKDRTAADGRKSIGNLPPRMPLRLSFSGRFGQRRDEPQPITLEPGERRELELWLGTGAIIRGVLVEPSGAPIAERVMWRALADGDAPGMFHVGQRHAAKTRTDEAGRFVFDDVPAAKWWIGPAPSRSSSDVPADGIAPFAQLVEVDEAAREVAIVCHASRDLYITGRVLDPSGEPAANCYVIAKALAMTAYGQDTTDGKGGFSIGPLAAGRWRVWPGGADADGIMEANGELDALELEAGTSDVVLRLKPSAGISGEVVDAVSGKRCECEVRLACDDPAAAAWTMTHSAGGQFSIGGLVAGTYVVRASTRLGMFGASDKLTLAAGERLTGLRIQVRTGATLELRYAGAATWVQCRIIVDDVSMETLSLHTKANLTVTLPPGAVDVRWTEDARPDVEHSTKLALIAGDRRAIQLVAGG